MVTQERSRLAAIITGMATGDLELSDVLRVLWKEFRIGIIVGICQHLKLHEDSGI